MIETDRLVLRRQEPGDAADFHRLWTERDPRVPPHRRIDADGRPTVADVEQQIRADLANPDRELLTVVRRAEDDVIGYCGLLFDGRGPAGEPEIAYELLRRVHGHGYATEAAAAVVARASERGHLRVWAGVRDWNLASRRVLEKLGFTGSGEIELDAAYGDSLVTVRVSARPG